MLTNPHATWQPLIDNLMLAKCTNNLLTSMAALPVTPRRIRSQLTSQRTSTTSPVGKTILRAALAMWSAAPRSNKLTVSIIVAGIVVVKLLWMR